MTRDDNGPLAVGVGRNENAPGPTADGPIKNLQRGLYYEGHQKHSVSPILSITLSSSSFHYHYFPIIE